MAMFDFPSFLIGLLIGMILMLLIVWIVYYTRAFAFSNCPTTVPICAGGQYYNDPGVALAESGTAGLTAGNILYIDENALPETMYYQRVPKTSDCAPGTGQTVRIANPQYCEFTTATGGINFEAKQLVFGSPLYHPIPGQSVPETILIETSGDCIPVDTDKFVKGVPILRWDSA